MDFFKNFTLTPLNVLKLAGAALLGLVFIAVIMSMLKVSFGSFNALVATRGGTGVGYDIAPSMSSYYDDSDSGLSYGESMDGYAAKGMPAPMSDLSVRNVSSAMPPIIGQGGVPGDDAEKFETKDYNATIETRDLADTCAKVADLKSKEYVVFLNTNESDQSCSYTFKVKNDRVGEILTAIKGLGPKDLNENVRTIKREIADFTSQEEILKKKQDTIDATLKNAIAAYDQITALANRTQDVESLAKIIDSKLQMIERLTQERLAISAQLDALSRAKSEELDKIDYTYFSVFVLENKYLDLEQIGDSWKSAIKQFIYDANHIFQDLSVGLAVLLLVIVQYLLYFFILLVVVKYGWQWAKAVWNR